MNAFLVRPEIGHWYAHVDKGEPFQVVGRDDKSRSIEIQYFDGDVDEIDGETWAALPIEPTEPPEDITAPMDDIETDDLGYSETDMAGRMWRDPLQPLRMQEKRWDDTESEDERNALNSRWTYHDDV